jgi:hypothetical protein
MPVRLGVVTHGPTTRSTAKILLVILGVIVGLGLLGLALVETTDQAAGCGSVDPTDPANYSTVVIRNDLPRPVSLGDCRGSYCTQGRSYFLDVGGSVTVNAACGVSGSQMTSWRVAGATGSTLGFLAVDSPKKMTGLVFRVSRRSPNRETATPAGWKCSFG